MSSKRKALVLFSAGLDSTVNLYEAIKEDWQVELALTFDYGQRAAKKEIGCSQEITSKLGVPHKIISLPWFKDFNQSSLLMQSEIIPTGKSVEIDDLNTSERTAKSVWVPNRNGIFINIAAGFAEALGAEAVITGFNAEEAQTFPDNSEEFMKAATGSLFFSTANHVSVKCFTSHLRKPEIVKLGESLKVPWNLIWPCYFSGEKWCGECESCQRAKRAFAFVGLNLSENF